MTSIEAQKLQDRIFQKMTADNKLKMVSHFFELGKELNKLNDRKINGGNRVSCKDRLSYLKKWVVKQGTIEDLKRLL